MIGKNHMITGSFLFCIFFYAIAVACLFVFQGADVKGHSCVIGFVPSDLSLLYSIYIHIYTFVMF